MTPRVSGALVIPSSRVHIFRTCRAIRALSMAEEMAESPELGDGEILPCFTFAKSFCMPPGVSISQRTSLVTGEKLE